MILKEYLHHASFSQVWRALAAVPDVPFLLSWKTVSKIRPSLPHHEDSIIVPLFTSGEFAGTSGRGEQAQALTRSSSDLLKTNRSAALEKDLYKVCNVFASNSNDWTLCCFFASNV